MNVPALVLETHGLLVRVHALLYEAIEWARSIAITTTTDSWHGTMEQIDTVKHGQSSRVSMVE